MEPLLVRAARREPVERTPVWFMRQAGRSLPEYRRIREQHEFFEINRSAELTAEVTLQPVRRHDVDAAVMFADIMTPVVAMGAGVELVEGVGPVVAEPVRTLAAVERLRVPDPAETVGPVLDAIRAVRAELRPDQAVVGFCGGPFTVAGYLVEGKPSRDFAVTKALMYREPAVWGALLDKLAATFAAYVLAQAQAGADIVQIFDSWVGALSPADYAEFAAPWSARVLAALADAGVPAIHFGTGRLDAAARDRRRRRRRHRPRLADPARRRLGCRRRTTAPCRGISTRRRCSAPGSASRPAPATFSPAPTAVPATSSISATAFSPAPTRTFSAACASSSTPRRHEELTLLAHRRDEGHLAPALPLFLSPGWVGARDGSRTPPHGQEIRAPSAVG